VEQWSLPFDTTLMIVTASPSAVIFFHLALAITNPKRTDSVREEEEVAE
jgi:hypothetical protein